MTMRKPLAIFISALMASSAANAAEIYNKDSNQLDLYGKVVGLNYISKNKSEHGDKSYVRLGFKGITQISDELSGFGQWEYNIKTHNAESMPTDSATRYAFVGLKFKDFGSIDYGRNDGVLYDVSSFTDVNPEFGGDSFTKEDNFMTGRAKNLATFRTSDFFGQIDGLSMAVQYQGKNQSQGKAGSVGDHKDDNGEGWGASTSYDLGFGIKLAGAYAHSHRTDAQASDKNGRNAEAWTVGMKYDNSQLYLAAMYAETNNMTRFGIDNNQYAHKTQNIELAAHYLFVDGPAEGLQPSLAYIQSVGKDLNEVSNSEDQAKSFKGGKHDLVKYIEVGTNYFFNKNMYTYIDYKINLLKKDDYTRATKVNTDNILGLGLVYQF